MKDGPGKAAVQQRALRVLKQKKLYEAQIGQLQQQTFNMEQAALTTENLRNTMATVDAMKTANKELRKQYGKMDIDKIEQMHYEMEDLIEQANEVQESMSRTYGVPDEVDEADLEAELDALGDDFAEEEEGIPSYLREDATELPDFVDEPPVVTKAPEERLGEGTDELPLALGTTPSNPDVHFAALSIHTSAPAPMSSVDIFPSNIALLGGIPTKSGDLAPSIIFLLCYFAITPIAVYRIITPSSRCFTLIRPVIFILVRIATFIVRSVQAAGTETKNIFIAEQILLLCGFILICEPLVTLTKYHVTRNMPPSEGKGTLWHRVMRLLQIALMIALILGISAGTSFSSLSDPSKESSVKSQRDANAIICLIITFLCGIVAVGGFFLEKLPLKPTLHLVGAATFLTVASLYKIVVYEKHTPPNPTSSGTKAAFYIFSSLMELVVVWSYVFFNIKEEFDVAGAREKESIEKSMRGGGGGIVGQIGSVAGSVVERVANKV
ncbi:hypothetical protein MNV49_006958 [Pseudohyphozyma bogoriensis]|nr:hypothetical protein MNV49_006958 [Pseudohyphozyma bogoriensis]